MPEQSTLAAVDVPSKDKHEGLFHIYSRYPAEVGDRALCGHVKPAGGRVTRYGYHPDLCVVCEDFYEMKREVYCGV